MSKNLRKKCAVCGDTNQHNVCLKWQRNSDNKVFHICSRCAEANKVKAGTVKEITDNRYTTVDSEFLKNTENGMLRVRPKRLVNN